MIEKPICETLEESQNLVKAAQEKDLVVQIGHIERFNPAYMELVGLLPEMEPLVITTSRLSPFVGSNVDVDVVLDLMIHDVNLVLDMIKSQPAMIQAQGLTAFSGTIDHANVQMKFPDKPLVSMNSSRITEHKVRRIEVTCREAFIECDLLDKSISIHRSTIGEYINGLRRSVKYRQESIVERINIPTFEPLFLQLQHFIDCVLEGNTPYVTATDGLEALELSTKISQMILADLLNMDRRKNYRYQR
jgi:predicted dehydrogenase